MIPDPDRFGPLGTPYVVVDFAEPLPHDPVWLADAPCPVIGFGDAAHPLAAHCDALVATAPALARMTRSIAQAPIAAAVLVQLLRAAERLALLPALTLESLAYATVQNTAESRSLLAAHMPPAPPPAETAPPLLISRTADALEVTLNRPGARNEISIEVRDALAEAFQLAALDTGIQTITLRGAGRCFSIGGALREFGAAPDQGVAHAIRVQRGPAFALAPVAHRTHAMVHGGCIGAGAELASLCARVTAHPCTFFQLPELRYGLIPGAGGTVGFARRIGRQRTALLALSAARLGARQALAWGLVDAISA
jgi:enoyl-CoA hydratase/carnithine racemase